jgi:hypothetical protein
MGEDGAIYGPPWDRAVKAEQPNTAAEIAWRDYGEVI